jgi:O-antigen/teichoic acid export membrane protein
MGTSWLNVMPERTAAAPGLSEEAQVSPADLATYKDANENRSLTAGLGGTCIAILTFVLIFLYDRAAAGQINNWLFQGTLLTIVISLSLISLSSLNYWFVMEALRTTPSRASDYQRRADGFFASSVILLLLEPTLILATVQLNYLAAVALALWGVGVAVLALGWRELK